jgi:UDP-N-acetyl-D-mannosaminuronate dehydrogenase
LKTNSLSDKNSLQNLIETKSVKIGIIGLGQVGLPTALSFCDVGFSVIGNDLNKTLLQKLSQGESPFEELGLDNILKSCIESKRFTLETNFEKTIFDSNIVIVCYIYSMYAQQLLYIYMLMKKLASKNTFLIY